MTYSQRRAISFFIYFIVYWLFLPILWLVYLCMYIQMCFSLYLWCSDKINISFRATQLNTSSEQSTCIADLAMTQNSHQYMYILHIRQYCLPCVHHIDVCMPSRVAHTLSLLVMLKCMLNVHLWNSVPTTAPRLMLARSAVLVTVNDAPLCTSLLTSATLAL